MKNDGEDRKHIITGVDGIETSRDGTFITGHAFVEDGIAHEEAKEALAEHYGVDPDKFILEKQAEQGRSVGKRVFGFSNWNGSNWEPTGPKGNPNLN